MLTTRHYILILVGAAAATLALYAVTVLLFNC